MSGRGGTTGRAAGWPARFGLAGGRNGPPPPTGAAGAGAPGAAAAGAPGRIAGRGVGMLGTGDAGRGAPGIVPAGLAATGPGAAGGGVGIDGGAFGNSPRPGGSGWRGPDRIWPGFGAGTGRAGMAVVRDTGAAGAEGAAGDGPPRASGGRNGCDGAGRAGAGSGSMSLGGSTAGAEGAASVSTLATGWGRAGSCVTAGAASTTGSAAGDSRKASAEGGAPLSPVRRRRTSRATSSSSELEWVFLSPTPSSGRRSRMTLGLTSSSRASSLMRILLIGSRPAV
jgi:hypothetical protein